MNELDLKERIKNNEIIDPVYIINKYFILSTYEDDIIFKSKKPIITGGIIKEIGRKVNNLKKNEFVGYISYNKVKNLILSSNLIVKINKLEKQLIFILPYASYAMNILRTINPKLGEKIFLIGLNFFSLLLFKLIRLSGANAYIVKFNDVSDKLKPDPNEEKFVFEFNSNQLKKINTDKILLIRNINKRIRDFIERNEEIFEEKELFLIETHDNFQIPYTIKITQIDRYDKGYKDPNYNIGIKYPYPYIRWDFNRNLQYFIELVEKKKIDLNFFTITEFEVKNLEEINENINKISEDILALFKL